MKENGMVRASDTQKRKNATLKIKINRNRERKKLRDIYR